MSQKIPLTIADFETQLSTAISIGSTTFSIASIIDDDGNTIPNGKYCLTVDNGSSNKEYLMGTMVAGDFTGVISVSRQDAETSGAVRAHRVGASVILTDFSVIKRVGDALRGADSLDGDNPLYYDATATLTDPNQLATVGYVLDVVVGGTIAINRIVVAGIAGETVAAGNLVYLSTSTGQWLKTDADDDTTLNRRLLGIAQGSGTIAASISGGVLLQGLDTNQSGMVAGTPYYASNTAGGISSSIGTTLRLIGIGTSTSSTIYFDPNFNQGTTNQTYYAQDTAANDTYTATIIGFGDYRVGQTVIFKAVTANTGACTLNINGLGARSIKTVAGADPITGNILAGSINILSFDGTNFQLLSSVGVNPITTVFSASGTWTKPDGLKAIQVFITGGGGGAAGSVGGSGGGSSGNSTSGGGGGATAMGFYTAAQLSSTVTVTIGAGSTGTSAVAYGNTPAQPSAGGTSTFGSYLTALGGGGGTVGTGGAAGVSPSIGFPGTVGGNGSGANGAAGGVTYFCATPAAGGVGGGDGVTGTAGTFGGGAGGCSRPPGSGNVTGTTGANGGNGYCEVIEYYF